MIRNLLLIFVLAVTFSCSSDDSNTEPNIIPDDNEQIDPGFYGLQVGNWWTYKNYKRNINTEAYDDTGVVDSVSIVGTQEFNGNTYFKFRRNTIGNEANITFCNPNGEHFEFLRDSLGNLVNELGTIKFTNTNYNERLINTQSWGTIYETLNADEASMTVEAGTFDCVFSQRYAKSLEGEQFPGLDHYYYADGIGLIYDTTSFTSTATHSIERRLDSYSVQ